jgi:hypothetical protein
MGFFWGSLVAVVGWGVSHWLTLRAQRENFRNQLLDRARMEIARSLHTHQDWLGRIWTTLMLVHTNAVLESQGVPTNWEHARELVRDLLGNHRAGSEWSTAMEEYESLFPETSRVRVALLQRGRTVLDILSKLSSDLMSATFPGAALPARQAVGFWAKEQQGFLLDQQSLLVDLSVHLQNASVGRITGAKVPLRKPTDPSVPMIVVGADGFLSIAPAAIATTEPKTLTKP